MQSMNQGDRDDLRRWADAWNGTSERLERERRERLRQLNDEDARQIISRIFGGPTPAPIERKSGLIEQQRRFRDLA